MTATAVILIGRIGTVVITGESTGATTSADPTTDTPPPLAPASQRSLREQGLHRDRQTSSVRPLTIPRTTPRRCVSFHRALNLRWADEDTGDWHALTAWFHDGEARIATLAGEGQKVDTTPTLDARGVREMAAELRRLGVPADAPVWVASHPRAIADLAMLDLLERRTPMIASVPRINAWLDTAEQLDELRERYLAPLRSQLEGQAQDILDEWLPTVRFE